MQQNKDFLFPLSSKGDLSLSDCLQLLAFEDFNGRIDLTSAQKHGQIFIENGTPIQAEFAGLTGDEAILKILETPTITFNTTKTNHIPCKNIENSLENLLIEFAFRSEKIDRKNALVITKSYALTTKSTSFLRIYPPSGEDFNFPISQNEISIGRAKNNLLSIDEKSISSHHALVFLRLGNYFIKDLHSANGILLNNLPIQESILKNGDRIQLGQVALEFQSKLKRPDLQTLSRSQLKNPHNQKIQKSKKNSYDVTTALRITNSLKSPSQSRTMPKNKTEKKQIIFFAITLTLLLAITLYAYLNK